MEKLVIFGGTFDPIHNGHLAIARHASLSVSADVVFVPAKSPRWKQTEASAEDRLGMLKAALKAEQSGSFSIDMFEMESDADVNYTIDTVRHMAEKYPDRQLFLLIGGDEVNLFPQWKDAKELSEMATPLYIARPGTVIDDAIVSEYHMRRLPVDETYDVSSKDVRSLRSSQIPLAVRDYIEKHELYYIKTLKEIEGDRLLFHSISVANLAFSIAQKNRVEDYKNAYIAGLLHDLGKRVPMEEAKRIMADKYHDYIDVEPVIYHQFVGAEKAAEIFGITDTVILDAIRYHTTGKPHMTPISKIVYSADKVEPTRGYDSTQLINSCLKNYYMGFLVVLDANLDFLKGKGVEPNDKLSKACFEQYLRRN